ncbi:MAG: amino acid-binding protein [Candidatus Altiarchaeales archaeon ex4484_2]|nr:MAG: amino acid-binding protein [Candidatus Altiarchaeales archaeon ex4484_2]
MIKQLSVFLENEPGRLVKVTRILEDAGIDIRALTVAETADFGILRLIVNDPGKAHRILKENSVAVALDSVLGVEVEDKPGGLRAIAEILAEGEVNIEYVYAFVTRSHEKAFVVLRVDDRERAVKVLGSSSIRLVGQDEVSNI